MATGKSFRTFGLGFYVNNSPSVCDPVALFRWSIGVQIGTWTHVWRIR